MSGREVALACSIRPCEQPLKPARGVGRFLVNHRILTHEILDRWIGQLRRLQREEVIEVRYDAGGAVARAGFGRRKFFSVFLHGGRA